MDRKRLGGVCLKLTPEHSRRVLDLPSSQAFEQLLTNGSCNWWNAANGPSGAGTGSGTKVGPNVTYAPWLTSPAPSPCNGNIATDKDQCKNGGWASLFRADGTGFKNQGDCIQYVNTGK